MKLAELKRILSNIQDLNFELPDGTLVPRHFHVTEIGQIKKHFIDCGGTVRHEKSINFQLWNAGDFNHRLAPQKLIEIIHLSERILEIEDAEIEVEYQADTIGKYGLDFNGTNLLLTGKQTACLANEKCGVPTGKRSLNLSDLPTKGNTCCTPDSGCC